MPREFNAPETSEEVAEERGREYTVAAAETPLFVKEVGLGPTVVVLHGGPGAHHDYLVPDFVRLADEFRLCFYDQRGGGRSRVRRPNVISWRDHVADLEALRRFWGIDRVALVGYSWGGLLALLYAAERAEKVRLMVLVAPAAGWGDYYGRFKERLARRSRADAVKRMREALEASGVAKSDPSAYRQRRFEIAVAGYFRDPSDARGAIPFQVQAQAQHATWASLRGQGKRLRKALRKVSAPTLILHGRHDPIPLEWAEELADVMPGARLVVLAESAHVPHVEEADRTFGEIRRFLKEHIDG